MAEHMRVGTGSGQLWVAGIRQRLRHDRGLDISVTRRIALRVFEADYYFRRFDNGVNDHQDNLRIAAGVIVRFGGSR